MTDTDVFLSENNMQNDNKTALERSYQVTNSLTNAYNTCFNFDIDNGTFSSLKGGDYLTYMSRSCGTELVLQNWLSMLPERSVDIMTAFLDFTTLDARMRNRNTISTEYVDAIGKWMRATLIVSDRDDKGHVRAVTLATQDIDIEKSNELEWKKAVRERINLLSSIANVFYSMYHIDFKNDAIQELSTEQTDRFYGLPLHQAWKLWIIKDFSKETYEAHKDFLNLDDAQKRLTEKGVLSDDILTIPNGWMNILIAPYRKDKHGKVVDALVMTRIIDKQKKAELKQAEALRIATESAFLDGLTGINNRTSLKNYMKEYDLSTEEMYVALFDIDKFKSYNDTYGHVMGDEALKSVAESINRISEQKDAFCCRYGGEEFVLIGRNKSKAEMEKILETISNDILEKKIEHSSTPIGVVSVSIGFAERNGKEDIIDTIKHADDALYNSKQNGRNRITFASTDIKSGQRLYDVTFSPSSTRYIVEQKAESTKNEMDEMAEALKIRSRQLDVVMDAIPGGLKVSKLDENYTFKYVSREAAAMFGYTVEEFIEYSQNSGKLAIIPEDRKKASKDIADLKNSDKFLIEYRVRCKDGSLKYVMDSGKRLTDSDGEEVVYSLYLDVTDEKKREEREKTTRVFTALSIDYDSLSLFNFAEDTFKDFYMSERYEEFSAGWRSAPGLMNRLETFAHNVIYEPDQERYLEAVKPENVYKTLSKKRAYYINYRIYKEDGTVARAQTKLVRDTTDPTGNTVIVCYISLDENGKRTEER